MNQVRQIDNIREQCARDATATEVNDEITRTFDADKIFKEAQEKRFRLEKAARDLKRLGFKDEVIR